jgi:hypothetical protein
MMSTIREPHYLVVALDAAAMEPGHEWSPGHAGCPDCNDNPFDLKIECPGVTAGGCNLWQECDTCQTALDAFGDDGDARDGRLASLLETDEVHGEKHMTFCGVPCVEGIGCFVQEAQGWGALDRDLWDIAREKGPGRYQIGWDGGDINDARAYLVTANEPERMTRPNTPDVPLPDGGTRVTVKRSCNGCGRSLGDASGVELDAAMSGAPLADVRDECGCL